MGMFNVAEFTSSANETILDDHIIPIPAGTYSAEISAEEKGVVIEPGMTKDKDGKDKPWARCLVRFKISDPTGELEKAVGRPPGMTYDFFLDLTEEGKFDYAPQRNVRLGALLKAAGVLKPGWRFTDMKGRRVTINVAHVKNDRDPQNKRAEVVAVGMAT